MRRILAALAVLFILAAGQLSGQDVNQLAVASFTYRFGVNAGQGYVAILDLQSPDVVPQVTGSYPCPSTHPGTAKTTTTHAFAKNYGTFIAITANTGPMLSETERKCGTPSGLIMSAGRWVNWPQSNGPVLYFPTDHSAVITDGTLPPLPQIRHAVAGTTGIPEASTANDCATCTPPENPQLKLQQQGTLLVKGGHTTNLCAIPSHTELAARGGAGLDSTLRYLILLVVEGDESERRGLPTENFAQLMIAFGAQNAVNFDGGGSTTFYWYPDQGLQVCAECKTKILNATGFDAIESVDLNAQNNTIEYSSQTPQLRPVWASLGFRLLKKKK